MANLTPWTFDAVCKRVIDGDTQEYTAQLFRDTRRDFTVRLLGINTPDSGVEGATYEEEKAATDYANSLLFPAVPPVPGELFLTGKRDKYGREIGTFSLGNGEDLGELLVEAGHAVRKTYTAHLAELTFLRED